MRVPTDADLRRTPPGDWGPRLAQVARHHAAAPEALERLDPSANGPTTRARATRHRRALADARLHRVPLVIAKVDCLTRSVASYPGSWKAGLTCASATCRRVRVRPAGSC